MKDQALETGADVALGQVTSVSSGDAVKTVVTGQDFCETANIILANDSTPRTFGAPDEAEPAGKGCGPNAARDDDELALGNGYIPVNERMETTLSGVYATDCIRVKQVRQVATAVSDGAIAAINAAAR